MTQHHSQLWTEGPRALGSSTSAGASSRRSFLERMKGVILRRFGGGSARAPSERDIAERTEEGAAPHVNGPHRGKRAASEPVRYRPTRDEIDRSLF